MLHYNQVLSLTGTILGVLIDATFDWMLHSNSNRMKTNATVATVSGQGNTIKAMGDIHLGKGTSHKLVNMKLGIFYY